MATKTKPKTITDPRFTRRTVTLCLALRGDLPGYAEDQVRNSFHILERYFASEYNTEAVIPTNVFDDATFAPIAAAYPVAAEMKSRMLNAPDEGKKFGRPA